MTAPLQTPTATQIAATQGGVVTWAQLRGCLGSAPLRRSIRAGDWALVVRGAYAERALVEAARVDSRLRHRLDCAAKVLLSGRDLVVSRLSAATLHGMTLLDPHTGPPQLMLPRPAGSPPAHVSGLHAAGLPAAHREVLTGVPVTSRARTVADLSRTLLRPSALVMADAALRAGVSRVDVQAVLTTCARWPGVDQAQEIVALADGRAESALESLARLWLADAGLPAPEPQTRLCHAADGRFVARVDLFWPQHRTVCELDGRLKYRDAPAPGDALWHEKLREDTLRDLGLEVVRGYWSDGDDGGHSLVDRVLRAFARAAARTDAPTYGILTSR